MNIMKGKTMKLREKEIHALRQAKRLKAFRIRNSDNENAFVDIYHHIQQEVNLYDNNKKNNQLTKSSADSARIWLSRYAKLIPNVELYWVSLLIQDTKNSKPWLCSMTNSCLSLEKAKEVIEKGRNNYQVLSAWIDTFDNKVKTTVFHECYVNTIGDVH